MYPTVQKQPKYFVSAPRLQLLLLLAPQALLYLWPPWPVPTIAPVGMAVHSSVLRIEKPDSLTRRFNQQQCYSNNFSLSSLLLPFCCSTVEVSGCIALQQNQGLKWFQWAVVTFCELASLSLTQRNEGGSMQLLLDMLPVPQCIHNWTCHSHVRISTPVNFIEMNSSLGHCHISVLLLTWNKS